ncbi:hypothetical protein AMK59_7925 [Oryctes borbonicus]|uniref:Protein ITFG3 n=1 Tax=Oryctes borbonicus TaxID=1629725 RepID=A0A0T6AZE6_9SCAR|nr:hypothetical protein AMK59_7925 [Oryctes borbonicus]
MANATQGMYAPLPQSISDSDSEKELQVDSIHKKSVNGIHKGFERSANGYMIPNCTMDNVKIKRGFKSMSLSRKYCFLFSILACFLTIAIFLWVLPCSENDTCPMHISNWENQHEDFEFKSRINIVNSAFADSYNLVILFKKSLNDADSKNGAMCILGNNGGISWYTPQVKEPADLNCYLIDVNGDGVKDCLLLGEMGLQAVDPISGQILYHVHNQNAEKGINSIDIPVILPDLNKDGINEMITVINGKVFHNKLVIVCGRTGMLLSKVLLKHCLDVVGLKYENKKFLYSCMNSTTTRYFEISYIDIENRYYNRSYDVTSIPINYTHAYNNEYKLSEHKLIVNNTGICPDCQSTIILLDNKDNQLWSLSHINSYAMKPTTFTFKSTKSNLLLLKGHINGYIVKLWQWSNYRMAKQDHIIDKRYASSMDTTIQTNFINERIVLITFNGTNVHVINASLIEITQLCFPIDGEYACQPDLANQEESLLIADLDNDKSQELVSYSSTFELKDGIWKLISHMKVIRLEAELPKLYEVSPPKLYEILL